MCELTVFTATYNRYNQLSNLYRSLLLQDFKDFEWLIVDDGSTDDTEKLIETFIQEKKITIHFHKQANAGKMVAYNHAVNVAKGAFFICIDSDDELVENILSKVHEAYTSIQSKEDCVGLGYLVVDKKTNEIVGTPYPHNPLLCSYYEMMHQYKVQGDKQLMFKTKIIKEYPFPVQQGEKFITEAVVYNRISSKYKMLFINERAALVQYNEDGYSKNFWKIAYTNPQGWRLYYQELYAWEPSLYNVYGYCLYSFMAKVSFMTMMAQHPSKFKVGLCSLAGYVKYKREVSKWKK